MFDTGTCWEHDCFVVHIFTALCMSANAHKSTVEGGEQHLGAEVAMEKDQEC